MVYIAAEPVEGTNVTVCEPEEHAEVGWYSWEIAEPKLPHLFEPVAAHLFEWLCCEMIEQSLMSDNPRRRDR